MPSGIRSTPVEKQCIYCGDDFMDHSTPGTRIYCNHSCKRKFYYRHNEEYRRKHKEDAKKWHAMNAERMSPADKEYIKEYKRKYYIEHKEHARRYRREYNFNNKKKAAENKRKKYKTDSIFRLSHILRTRFRTFLKQNNCRKGGRSFEIFGATPQQIKSHIESLFKDDMTWENQGEWHIDHIIPLDYYAKSFDLNDLEVQKKAFNYKNLQPLWAFENLSKSNKRETLETTQ